MAFMRPTWITKGGKRIPIGQDEGGASAARGKARSDVLKHARTPESNKIVSRADFHPADFTPESRQAIKDQIHAVVSRIPEAAQKVVAKNVKKILPMNKYALEAHASVQGINTDFSGWWLPRSGQVAYTTKQKGSQGILAHEFGHAVDKDKKLSDSVEWRVIHDMELVTGKLSKYATRSAAEGFAEFARAAWWDSTPERLRAKFPRSYSFFKKRGLV